jgi:hypothetical protein
MLKPLEREQFIPVRVADVITHLLNERGPNGDTPLSVADQELFRRFAERATTQVHTYYLDIIKKLGADYAVFDPDSEMLGQSTSSDTEKLVQLDDLIERFAALLADANFKRLTRAELEVIMRGASEWGVDMRVPWDAYEKVDLFVRGRAFGRRIRRRWYRFFRLEEVIVPVYSRVVLILKQREHKALGKGPDTKHVFLKLFKDIPTMDLEMLLPGTSIRMPWLDRVRLGGSGLSSLGYVLFKLQAMLTPLLKAFGLVATGAVFGEQGIVALIALYAPLALVGGYAYKTYASFNTTKQSYELQLSQSLYFQNLDNNAGVLFRLLDAAEEQESRELLLSYYFLWKYAGEAGWTAKELDHYIELELGRKIDREVDFDIDDALNKLQKGNLAVERGGRWHAVPLAQVLARNT